MKRALISLFIILLGLGFSKLKAQQGNFFLTHYTPTGKTFDNINFDIAQDSHGIICIANRTGVLRFDGKNWDFIKTPSATVSIVLDSSNNIYTGGLSGFGMIKRDDKYKFKYHSLSDQFNATDISKVLLKDGLLYAINARHIYRYNLTNSHHEVITPKYQGELEDLFEFENHIYIQSSQGGFQLLQDKKLVSPKSKALTGLNLRFINKNNNGQQYLIGTTTNELFVYTPLQGIKNITESLDHEYLQNNDIQNGLWLTDTLCAISTLRGGIVFINPIKEKVTKIINYQSGLPDNQVLAMAVDTHKGVWVAHSRGMTRISPYMPFQNYNLYPGLKGKVLCVKNHRGKLFVGTTTGVFYLDEVRNYNDIIKYTEVSEQVIIKHNKPATPTLEKEESSQNDDSKRKKGLFSFLHKKEETEKVNHPEAKQEATSRSEIKTVTHLKKEIEQELKSIQYIYKKIDNVESNVFSLEEANGQLFCAGLDGLFEIRSNEAIRISSAPIRTSYISKNYNKIFASTFNDRLQVFDLAPPHTEINIFDDFKDDVHYIFEDTKHRVWFCGMDELYWISMQGNNIKSLDEYEIDNPYYYETYGVAHGDSLLFINKNGIYALDAKAEKLQQVTKGDSIARYLHGSNDHIWVKNGTKWKTLASNIGSQKIDMLSAFKDITFIDLDAEDGNFWVITDNGDLYKVATNSGYLTNENYQLLLKDIKSNSEEVMPTPELVFDQQNSQLMFEFIQPEYSGIIDIQYQYKLEGLNKKWSEWSPSYNVIDFPYLPDGKYKLHVRSKNIFGQINNSAPISFEIIPPYWKRPWFYVMEFCVLSLILLLSINLRKIGYKYPILSRILGLLTLIIIIEFIQTTAENEFSLSSPVIDFIIQIIIAIIILPVEGLLRKYIFREKDVRVLDFISVKDLKEQKKTQNE